MKNLKFFLGITAFLVMIYLVGAGFICTYWLANAHEYEKETCYVAECVVLRTNCQRSKHCYDVIFKFQFSNSTSVDLFHFTDIDRANNFCSMHSIGSEITCYCDPNNIDDTLTLYETDNYSFGLMILIIFTMIVIIMIGSIYVLNIA